MVVSIVTRTIGRASLVDVINDVQGQYHKKIEHIIISGHDRFKAADEGLKRVTGDIVLILDDDDRVAPDHLQKAVEAFAPDIFYVNTGVVIERNGALHHIGREFMSNSTMFFIHSSCFFFRSVLLKEFNYLDPKYNCPCEDAAFYCDIASKYPGIYTGANTSRYIQHNENTSGMVPGKYHTPSANMECHKKLMEIIANNRKLAQSSFSTQNLPLTR